MAEKKLMYAYNPDYTPGTRGKKSFTPATPQNAQFHQVINSDAPDRAAMRLVSEGENGNTTEYEGGGAGRGKVNPTKGNGYAKGGSAKGWGKARSARAAKIY